MLLAFILLFLVPFFVSSQHANDLRLIEFNETYREWMPYWKVEKVLMEECGFASGFMDHNRDTGPFACQSLSICKNQNIGAISNWSNSSKPGGKTY